MSLNEVAETPDKDASLKKVDPQVIKEREQVATVGTPIEVQRAPEDIAARIAKIDEEAEEEDDEEDEEENKYEDNEFLKEDWKTFVMAAKEGLGDVVDLPDELPDDCPSEPEADSFFEDDSYADDLESLPSIVKLPEAEMERPVIELENLEEQPTTEVSTQQITVKDSSTKGAPIELKRGVNEYMEEDKWELWYRFIHLMNNDKLRSYDNVAALFQAKKQEILTRKNAPVAPWDEPGLNQYERDRRRLQREWDKTERYSALESQKGYSKFLHDVEGVPLTDEGCTEELEETYRTIFSLLEDPENYNHQAYKDTLSREELSEIYSPKEVEAELRGREERKQGSDYISQLVKAEASGDVAFAQVPRLKHTHDLLKENFFNQPVTEFTHYDTVPDHIKNNPYDPINFKIYSNKMDTEGSSLESTNVLSGQNEEPAVATANEDNKTPLSKGELGKKMWQYFLQLMRERHEKNMEKFTSQHPPPQNSKGEDARLLWDQYAAFSTGRPVRSAVPEKIPEETVAPFNRSELVGRVLQNPTATTDTTETWDEMDNTETRDTINTRASYVKTNRPRRSVAVYPSVGWRTLTQRIEAMKSDPTLTGGPCQQKFQAQAPPPQDHFSDPPYQNRDVPRPPWPPQNPYFQPPPGSYPPGAYPQQVPGQYKDPYGQGQGVADPRRQPAPSRDPYAPPMRPNQPEGYGYPPNYPMNPKFVPTPPEYPPPPPPTGLEGMSKYYHSTDQQGNYPNSYMNQNLGFNIPPNIPSRAPEMGYHNPSLTQYLNQRSAYMANQANPYTASRSKVAWAGDHSDKMHNSNYLYSELRRPAYIPTDVQGQPGDYSSYYNQPINNPYANYRTDTYNQYAFPKGPEMHGERSIRWWQSGSRPLASSGLQAVPPIETSDKSKDPYQVEKSDHIRVTDSTSSKNLPKWPCEDTPTTTEPELQLKEPENNTLEE